MSKGKKSRVQIARTAVRLGIVVLVAASFAFDSGLGTLCAAGVGRIAALCPLGAVESLAAGKLAVPQALVMTACALVLAVLFGRAFCGWICPVPPIEHFFHPSGAAKAKAGKSSAAAAAPAPGNDAAEAGGDAPAPGNDAPAPSGDAPAAGGDALGEAAASSVPAPAGSAAAGVVGHATCGAEGLREAADAPAAGVPAALAEREKELLASACPGDCARCLRPVGGVRDGLRLDSRHAVLAGAVASSAVFGFPVLCLVCPIGLAFATLVALWRAVVEADPSWSLLVFPAILLVELVVFRRWCLVLCPMGALLSLVGAKAPMGRPRVDDRKCLRARGVDCRVCVDSCPEQIDPHSPTIPDCTRCAACMDACPTGAVRLGMRPRRS